MEVWGEYTVDQRRSGTCYRFFDLQGRHFCAVDVSLCLGDKEADVMIGAPGAGHYSSVQRTDHPDLVYLLPGTAVLLGEDERPPPGAVDMYEAMASGRFRLRPDGGP